MKFLNVTPSYTTLTLPKTTRLLTRQLELNDPSEEPTMNKTLALLAALLLSTGAYADEIKTQELTLAAADVGVKASWIETQEDVEARISDELNAKEDALNDKAQAKLEEQLEAKLAARLER